LHDGQCDEWRLQAAIDAKRVDHATLPDDVSLQQAPVQRVVVTKRRHRRPVDDAGDGPARSTERNVWRESSCHVTLDLHRSDRRK